jgi:COP9 signalosome complex subunit 3
MVSFNYNPEKYDNPVIMEQLMNQMFKCVKMDSNIKEMDKEITTHPHYIQKCQTNSATACDDAVDQLLQ